MLKGFYAALSFFVCAVLLVCAYRSRTNVDKVGKSMTRFLYMGALSIAGYSIVFFSNSYIGMSVGNCVFFACMDWLLYSMFRYAAEYTGYAQKGSFHLQKGLKAGLILILAVDSASMLCNIVFEHAMKFRVIYQKGERFLQFLPQPIFYVHLAICYVLVIIVIYVYLIKILTSPRIYQIKYSIILATLMGVVLVNAAFLVFKPSVDVSIYLYALAALSIDHFTFHYIPRYLERYMQRLAQDKQQDLIIMFDDEDRCVYQNHTAEMLLQQESKENEKFTKAEFEKVWSYEDEEQKTAILLRDDRKLYYTLEYEALCDENGKYMGCFYVMHDMTKERELQEKYRYLATHDALTGLYNRPFFLEMAERYMRKNPNEKYLIICSDIRQFKAINDIFGVETGDHILVAIAEELKNSDDHNRVYGRIASDSFAICIPVANFKLLDYMIKSGNVLHVKNINYPIVNHIGIYEVEDLNISVAAMCDRAMLAINSIKEDMQQEVAYYDDRLREELLREQEVLKDLTPAFEEKQFTVYLQPQFHHKTGAIVGAETLVRWIHPDKGMIPPYIFIPMMENNGLISKLDTYVWRMACELLKKYEQMGKEISLSVNISPKDFYYMDLYHEFMTLVTEYDIEPSKLKLEITESAVMQDVPKQVALIKRLQAEGFIVEMDDFGSGFSSLNTLKDIPVDILKLDMKFMAKSEHADRSANILEMMVAMADRLHMPVIAEGVETKEQADFLGSIGCDIIQGYYYAKPMPVEEFDELLTKYPYQNIFEEKGSI